MCGADFFGVAQRRERVGSSPRVRSRPSAAARHRQRTGIISACAEQTKISKQGFAVNGDHLRVCGADGCRLSGSAVIAGSSPRVRSRPVCVRVDGEVLGIISACAEQTPIVRLTWMTAWDHLRVCGADYRQSTGRELPVGSSPRVRSRPRPLHSVQGGGGIISACAEQTWFGCAACDVCGDHLRVCGADFNQMPDNEWDAGSSPRVRSRLGDDLHALMQGGIISACAEQTVPAARRATRGWDHLRVCGADPAIVTGIGHLRGSSPRVRSRRVRPPFRGNDLGIISACAEQTLWQCYVIRSAWDHLRVCGADEGQTGIVNGELGSSPRVRSRPRLVVNGSPPGRIISACAEQTQAPTVMVGASQDHLRVCGADCPSFDQSSYLDGSSPRVRSRPAGYTPVFDNNGIISACAEQTWIRGSGGRSSNGSSPRVRSRLERLVLLLERPVDHLRVCGADMTAILLEATVGGSSPRVRSRPGRHRRRHLRRRIISACAEQTRRPAE